MRLWHTDLIQFLPRTQLLAQWRELNSIFKKEDDHILINYIYNGSDYKETIKTYADLIVAEFKKRGYHIRTWGNYNEYFKNVNSNGERFTGHNVSYLLQCYFNLQEKYYRGQEDYSFDEYKAMNQYMRESYPTFEVVLG